MQRIKPSVLTGQLLTGMLLIGAAASASRAQTATVRTCEFEVKPRCASGEVHATFDGGELARLAIDVFWCGLEGQPGYSCVVNYSRNDGDSIWTQAADAVVIDKKAPWNPDLPDRIKVTVGKHVSIDLEEAQSAGTCGAGAELPRAIVIPEGKGKCRVWLDAP